MDLREECLGAKKIGISGHIRPDGDCVGVCLSLQMYLRKLLPEAEVTVYLQKPSEEFSYLKGYDEIQTECPVQEPFDVLFINCYIYFVQKYNRINRLQISNFFFNLNSSL